MSNVVRVAKRLIPIEQIVLVEPYVQNANASITTGRDFKSRLVLLINPVCLPKQRPRSSLGNPYFIQKMHDWFVENDQRIVYAGYFDVDGLCQRKSTTAASRNPRSCFESCSGADRWE